MTATSSLAVALSELLDLLESRSLKTGVQMPIQRGSATGFVVVIPDPRDPAHEIVEVRLTIMPVPPERAADLLRRLLELNATLHGRAAFALTDEDMVVLTAGRSTQDLDPGELVDVVLWTAEQADYFDDVLLAEFGA
ncbi:MAG: hypothetical protein HKO53_16455 [Gemmatimonadetes bacterium]|nr:hypothetical protein [Gemmatimonadota bacterium]NNM34673.1 hypothetical protein [Gemmatimonadota bacterium]